MSEILSWFSWLGIGGIAAAIGIAYFLPSLLPSIAVSILKGVGETVAAVLQYIGGRVGEGLEHIFANRAAVFTLVLGVLAGGYLGDKYEWVRPYIPEWVRSESGQVKAARAQERARHKATAKKTPAAQPQANRKSAWSDIRCNLIGDCVR
jgi:hypothetical protein